MSRQPTRQDDPIDDLSEPVGNASWRGPVRLFSGLLLVAALAFIAVRTMNDRADGVDAFSEGLFLAVTAIGVVFGLYIATRADD